MNHQYPDCPNRRIPNHRLSPDRVAESLPPEEYIKRRNAALAQLEVNHTFQRQPQHQEEQ